MIKEDQQLTRNLVQIALVAALYVAVTLMLAPFSFSVIQVRIAEMFNFLVLFNRKYIWGVTLGVVIANFASPFGIIDVIVGSLSTFLVLGIVIFVTKHIKHFTTKLWTTAILCALSMATVALELAFILDYPFWQTYLFTAIGEFISMAIGAILISLIRQKVDIERLLR